MEQNISSFCFYCGKKTELIHKEIRKPFNGKIITINNVPLFFCRSCREIFYPAFVVNLFNSMSGMEHPVPRYNFEDIYNNYYNKSENQ